MPKRKPGDTLNHPFVNAIKKPGTYGDGYGSKGLKLVVRRKGQRRKLQRPGSNESRSGAKNARSGWDHFRMFSWQTPGTRPQDNWQRAHQGIDILQPPPAIPTVAQGFEEVINERKGGWKEGTEYAWRLSLRHWKLLRSIPVSDVTEDERHANHSAPLA